MRVYRIENDETKGPYCTWILNNCTTEPHNVMCGDRVPTPQDDIGRAWDNIRFSYDAYSKFRFGFETLEQLKEWFHAPARQALALGGFAISVYDTKTGTVLAGKKQVAFQFDAAERLERIPLPTEDGS